MERGCLRAPPFRYALALGPEQTLPSDVSDIIQAPFRPAMAPISGPTAESHPMSPGTLADDVAPLPQADAAAADPVVASLSARQGRWLALAAEFLRFGTVGGLGLLWDVSTFYIVRPFLGFAIATLASFMVAATMNWMLNRLWTFRGRGSQDSLFRQWLSFMGANGPGFMLNRSAFGVLAWFSPFCFAHPVVALAAGSLAGMTANFTLSRRLVFRGQVQ